MNEVVERGASSPPMLVYLFYHYAEYGPEEIKATLDVSRLVEVLSSYKDKYNMEKKIVALEQLISDGIEADQCYGLSGWGWGGFCLDCRCYQPRLR
jgi:hypothetical protein